MDRFGNGFDEFCGFDPCKDSKSQAFGDVLRCFVLKVVADGAEKVLKDGESRRRYALGNHLTNQFLSRSGENVENAIHWRKTCQVSGACSLEEEMEENGSSLEEESKRVCTKPSNFSVLERESSECEFANSSSKGCFEFSLNFPAFLAMMTLKLIAFQINLAIGFLTFPIWFSYFLFTFLMFPFHTLSRIKRYLIRKLLTTLEKITRNVIIRAKRSVIRLGYALFWSGYVCSVLVGLLVLGFLLGGFLMRCLVEEPVMTKETLHFDYTKSSPVALVPLSSSSYSRAIPYNQKLQLTVSLTVPESEYNRKLGVFQVRVEFLSSNGKATANSSYPCMLRFKSQTIRFVETAIRTAPLLAGFQSESQILNIKTSEFREGLEPTTCVRVSLEQRAEYKNGAGIPQVYTSSLALESAVPRLSKMMWLWRRTVFVWVSFMLFLMELMTVLLFCRPFLIPRQAIISNKKGSSHLNALSWCE